MERIALEACSLGGGHHEAVDQQGGQDGGECLLHLCDAHQDGVGGPPAISGGQARRDAAGDFHLAPAAAPDAGTSVAWGNERGRLVVEAAKHGKVVIATGVRDAREFAELLKLGVHYVQADVFAPWSADANFDFAGTKV